ncbi:MAG: permease-like cell division protein FtsX [Candidatus Paceibacterota bacterium]|jgi:cell division transport system permease protein|nr:permease-like cell division protein FtsX [Candidatus Paceibacterota bacterium]MDD5621004.1 permease-like cell division protein FtsX [Candidatus Paceibacterota bacterium]
MFTPLKRVLKLGALNFRRQKSLNIATIFVLFIAIAILTSLFFLKSSLNHVVSEIEKKVDMNIYLQEELSLEKSEEIKTQLMTLEEVEGVEYVSAQQALEDFKKRHENDTIILQSLEVVGSNPFYPSFNVRAKSAGQYATVIGLLDRDIFKDIVYRVDYLEKKAVIEKVFSLASNINLFGMISVLILGLISVLIAFNTIRTAIKDNAEEIGVMKLVGASNWYVQGPFIIQASLCGLISSLICFFVFFVVSYFGAPTIMAVTGGFNSFGWFSSNAFLLFFLQISVSIGLSVISSIIAIRKYLKV